MQDKNAVLDAYEKGDAYERLHLYMSYPELRRVFGIIDKTVAIVDNELRNKKTQQAISIKSNLARPTTLMRMIRGWVHQMARS